MRTIATADAACYAAVGPDAEIWYARRGQRPLCVGREMESLSRVLELGGQRPLLRIVGTARNATLICGAAALHAAGRASLELGTPALLGTRGDRDDAAAVLAYAPAAADGLPAAAGGWHRFASHELGAYRAAAADAAGEDRYRLVPHLEDHPAFRRLGFLDPCSPSCLASLMAAMRDPRWYVDPERPDRVGRLYAYFGVGKRRELDPVAETRRAIAEGVWYARGELPRAAAGPRGFLALLYFAVDKDEAGARRSVTRCMLRLVQAVWLDRIHGDRELFVPEYFFARALGPKADHRGVAAAYREFVSGA